MTMNWWLAAWNRFFFTPQSPLPIALFRIFYGLCVTATILLLHQDWLQWYGVDGWARLESIQQIEPGMRLNLFTVMPQDDRWIAGFFWLCLLSALLVTIGAFTRISSVVLFLCLTSMDQRNLLMLHGGDTFLRVAGFFLMFAPAGALLSVDRLARKRRGLESDAVRPRAPWAQRMIQIELAVLYFTSFCWKVKGHAWLDGSALYYVLHLHSVARFTIPQWIQVPLLLKLGAWFTLALEFSLGTLIWLPPFRYPLLLFGLLFHLSIDYALNLPMFSLDVLSAYVLFVKPADLARMESWIRRAFAKGTR
jgi:hypothetical protein